MKPVAMKILKYAGYVFFALMVMLFTVYAAFPYERLTPMIKRQLSQGGRYQVTIGSVGPAFLAGVTLKDVVVTTPAERPKDKPGRMVIKEAVIKYSIWALLTGKSEVSFHLTALGGEIEGSTEKTKKRRIIELEIRDIDFKKTPAIAKAVDLPMKGKLSGKGKITIPSEGLRKAEGKFTLKCKKCSVGDGKTKVKIKFGQRPGRYNPMADKGITLPRFHLGKFGGDIVIKKGKAEFSQFEAFSKDGEASLVGHLLLREPFIFSTAQLLFKFKFSDDVKKRKAKVLGIETGLARARRSDGFFGYCFSGRLKHMRPRPCRYSPVDRHSGRRGVGRRGGPGGRGFRRGRRRGDRGRGFMPPRPGGRGHLGRPPLRRGGAPPYGSFKGPKGPYKGPKGPYRGPKGPYKGTKRDKRDDSKRDSKSDSKGPTGSGTEY